MKSILFDRLADVAALLRETLPYLHITETSVREKIFFNSDFHPELCFGIEEAGALRAFGYGIRRKNPYAGRGLEPHKAWVPLLVTHPQFRRRGFGSTLLASLEGNLFQQATSLEIGKFSPLWFTPGAEKKSGPFFACHGYSSYGEVFAMERSLAHIPEASLPDAEVRLYGGENIFAEIADSFGQSWAEAAKEGAAQKRLAVLWGSDGRFMGFARWGMEGDRERFGPFGVFPQYRKGGLGGLLFLETARLMRSQGAARLYFLSAEEKVRHFYENLEMRPFQTFETWHKTKS